MNLTSSGGRAVPPGLSSRFGRWQVALEAHGVVIEVDVDEAGRCCGALQAQAPPMSARRFQPDVLQIYRWACYQSDVVRKVAGSILIALVSHVGTVKADCFDDAAVYQNVNPWILRAIAARESGFKPNTLVSNSNHTVDIGQAGINSVHLPELARYGIAREDLLDGCKSTYVSAWHLAKKIRKFGNNWQAIGSYNSETPRLRDIYADKIRAIIKFWIAQGIIRE